MSHLQKNVSPNNKRNKFNTYFQCDFDRFHVHTNADD